ncbi:MAG: DUF3696 domain-containing protein [Leptospiraceae bacterium]|nr:DUF3696 domain-containing protein [Leptospiraceae bacterium]
MITSIHIQNFKSHKDTQLKLGSLTILCGANGVGKSSIFQSLLLLRQTHQKNRLLSVLSLNKPLCYIGKGKDALYQFAETDKISIGLESTGKKLKWIFDTEKHSESDFLEITKDTDDEVATETRNMLAHNKLQSSLFEKSFQFISAARISKYESDDYAVDIEKQISIEEGKAELTAQFLFKYRDEQVSSELLHPKNKNDIGLLAQTIAWEKEISKGVSIEPIQIGTNYDILYSFEIEGGVRSTNKFTSKNVGFGLSYALPIIVAVLSAPKGSLILIENPEAHLHPAAQSKLAELLCLAAQSGVQVILETHSDHVVNGTMVQCKYFETKGTGIDKNNVKIFYFDKDEQNKTVRTTEVELKDGGRIKKAPPGFFDQMGKDLRVLMGTSANRNE